MNTRHRVQINIDTLVRARDFVNVCAKLPAGTKIQLVDKTGAQRINATSLLGAIATVDWSDGVYAEYEGDVYEAIKPFIVGATLINDAVPAPTVD